MCIRDRVIWSKSSCFYWKVKFEIIWGSNLFLYIVSISPFEEYDNNEVKKAVIAAISVVTYS